MDNKTYMHLVAFRESVAPGSAYVQINGVLDQVLSQSANSNFFAPRGGVIYAGFASGVDHTNARINTPTMREVGFPELAPANQGTTVPSPPNLPLFGDYGPMPTETDEISVEAFHSNVAAQVQYALLWLKFGIVQVPTGRSYRIPFTSAIAAVVGSWASGAIVLSQTLPAGNYAIVGMDLFGANLLAGRLIFPGGGWRPGVLARNAVGSIPHNLFTGGKLGTFGVFNNTALPTLEIYAEAANAAQTGFLDLIKV